MQDGGAFLIHLVIIGPSVLAGAIITPSARMVDFLETSIILSMYLFFRLVRGSLEEILEAVNQRWSKETPAGEIDAVVKMPPVRKYMVRAKVQEVRKPSPKPVYEVEQ